MRALLLTSMVIPLLACAPVQPQEEHHAPASIRAAPDEAHAEILDRNGRALGNMRLKQDGDEVALNLMLEGFSPGEYGMHLHGVGKCEGPNFVSAGGHWNPSGAEHGLKNPKGSHAGDLANIIIPASGKLELASRLSAMKLVGKDGLLDVDGGAIVIHAKPDDNMTDPSGNSGERIACGVFVQLIF